jgi:hypothetical protein
MKLVRRVVRSGLNLGLAAALGALLAGAQARKVHEYKLHEPEARGAPFGMVLGPDHTVYTLIPRQNGQWILSEVVGWWQDKPVERGILVEGFSTRDAISTMGQIDLRLSADGQYLVTLLTAGIRVAPDDPYPMDMIVEAVRLDTFEVASTEHMRSLGIRGNLQGTLDHAGRLVVNSEVPAADENGGAAAYRTWFAVTVPDMKAKLVCSYGSADAQAMEASCGEFAKKEGYATAAELDNVLQAYKKPQPPAPAPSGIAVSPKDRVQTKELDVEGKPLTLVVVNGVDLQVYAPQ